jgi:archaeosine synthase beta-subunit
LAALPQRDTKKAAGFEIVDCVKGGKKFVQLQVFLVTPACAHTQKSGCSMCGFWAISTGANPVSKQDLLDQFESIYAEHRGKVDDVIIFNNGSFFDIDQMPEDTAETMVEILAADSHLREITVETRPEYLEKSRLRKISKIAGDKKVEVCIGLETADDRLRPLVVNKGYTYREYCQAIGLLKNCGYHTMTYNLLKPPFLTEREAIAEASDTIDKAFAAGCDVVSLEAAFVTAQSFLEICWREGYFSPPWFWSIIEVLKKASGKGEVRLGYFDDEPPPIALPHGCPKCDEKVRAAFEQYRDFTDPAYLEGLDCECRVEWHKDLCVEAPPVEQRVAAFTEKVKDEICK